MIGDVAEKRSADTTRTKSNMIMKIYFEKKLNAYSGYTYITVRTLININIMFGFNYGRTK